MKYGISSRDYLDRAEKRLKENTQESLFYAAFELRCGIESRMQEYLENQEQISKKKKQGWQIAKLGKNIEQVFKKGNKVVQILFRDKKTGDVTRALYYTPVTQSLQKKGQQLGVLLHALRNHVKLSDSWWGKTRNFLNEVLQELQKATTGTLLGVPLLNKTTNKVTLFEEAPKDENIDALINKTGAPGSVIILDVRYFDDLPHQLEETK